MLLARVAWVDLFGLYLDFGGKPYPFHRLKSLDLFQKIQFSWHSIIKNSKKNATRAEYSHQFSADFPVFPPTSSSPLLQIHLAEGSATKSRCLESDQIQEIK
jgi:hypothetical protein